MRLLLACRTACGPELQNYLAHKQHPPPRTLQEDFTYGCPRGGGQFLMSEVLLYVEERGGSLSLDGVFYRAAAGGSELWEQVPRRGRSE
jgi:hypothetical protein